MPANALLNRLATIYLGEDIRYPSLRPVTFAQWMLESGRATSRLAKDHYNFGGLKWRPEMAGFATKVRYEAHDGVEFYCKFATIENFVGGYWAFLNRSPYSGWEQHVSTPEDFIGYIGPVYTPSRNYARRVLSLVPEAEQILADAHSAGPESATTGTARLGTIVIDPGHGGTRNMPGSSANNAISVSHVKEKKLTLDFCLILRDELTRQASAANEAVKVVLTRTTDINLSGSKRADMAFENQAKLFLCLHFNGGPGSTRGCETFFRAAENGNLNLAADKAFAEVINTAVFSSLTTIDFSAIDRGVKPDTQTGPGALGVLNDKRLGNDQRPNDMCSSAYLELEYITNPKVDKLLVSGPDAMSNRTKVMASVAKAIRKNMREMV